MNRPTLFVLIILNALCAALLVGEWVSTHDISTESVKKNTPVEQEEEPLPEIDLSSTSEEDYSDLVERPMFIKGRKPVPEPEVENTAVVEEKRVNVLNWDLTGIFTSPKGITAFFNRTNGKIEKDNYRKLRKGDDLEGWKIADIHSNQVILTQSEQSKTLLLRKSKPQTALPTNNTSATLAPVRQETKIKQGTTVEIPPVPANNTNPDDLSDETVNSENQ